LFGVCSAATALWLPACRRLARFQNTTKLHHHRRQQRIKSASQAFEKHENNPDLLLRISALAQHNISYFEFVSRQKEDEK
jgi:hypothetical protein